MNHSPQPICKDDSGTLRFKANAIVQHLLDTHPSVDMNVLARMEFSNEDRQQFAQLIGYSLNGYGELRYVDDVAWAVAGHVADGKTPQEARIEALEDVLADLKERINALRHPVAELFGLHPSDLAPS